MEVTKISYQKFSKYNLSKKGLKGYTITKGEVIIKTKEHHLMTPQQREVYRGIFTKPYVKKKQIYII